jgi:hypothetical protein
MAVVESGFGIVRAEMVCHAWENCDGAGLVTELSPVEYAEEFARWMGQGFDLVSRRVMGADGVPAVVVTVMDAREWAVMTLVAYGA